MLKRDYDRDYTKNTGNTETHIATDERMKMEDPLAYEEGFASASGVRPETSESGGRVRHPENKDAAKTAMVPNHIDEEDAGLAES